jgi:hypothetical protein
MAPNLRHIRSASRSSDGRRRVRARGRTAAKPIEGQSSLTCRGRGLVMLSPDPAVETMAAGGVDARVVRPVAPLSDWESRYE